MTDTGRRRRPRDRHVSRFARGKSAAGGGRDLIRYRRNREVLAREVTVCLLWLVVSGMLVNFSGTLWRVAHQHLADQPRALQVGLPALALAAAVLCLWRAKGNVLEILDVRKEQAELSERLKNRSRNLADDESN